MSMIYITTQGAMLRKRAGRFVVTKGQDELITVPESAVDSVMLAGYVQVTTQAVHELLERGIPLVYMSYGGRFKGILQPGSPKNVFVRLSQYDAHTDFDFCMSKAAEVVAAKAASQNRTLAKWVRNGWLESYDDVEAGQQNDEPQSIAQLMSREALFSRCYFDQLANALPPLFTWHGRSRQPPLDEVNAMLSFAYMMIFGKVVSRCYALGLDPAVGMLHQLEYSRPSLALDIMEPLRSPFADHYMMRLLQQEEMALSDFQRTEENGCRFESEGLHRFISGFEAFASGTGRNEASLSKAIDALLRDLIESLKNRGSQNSSGV